MAEVEYPRMWDITAYEGTEQIASNPYAKCYTSMEGAIDAVKAITGKRKVVSRQGDDEFMLVQFTDKVHVFVTADTLEMNAHSGWGEPHHRMALMSSARASGFDVGWL